MMAQKLLVPHALAESQKAKKENSQSSCLLFFDSGLASGVEAGKVDSSRRKPTQHVYVLYV